MKKALLFFLFSSLLLAKEPSLLTFGGGVFEIVRHNRHETGEFKVEYRPSSVWYTFRPTLGFLFTLNGSTYLYGGFGFEWILKRHLLFSPNFALGWYAPGGGKNLGFPLEFRSGVEMAWIFPNKNRFGAGFYHISNASLGNKNPGVECLDLFFSISI